MSVPGFFWLYRDTLAGSGRPGGHRSSNATYALDDDLRWLVDRNVRAILTLTESPLPEDALSRFGITSLHLPVPDLTPPTPDQFTRALEFIDSGLARGTPTLVHCLMGQGRTGTVLAAYLVRSGLTPESAIQRIRALCPGAIEAPEQERAIEALARRRDWIV